MVSVGDTRAATGVGLLREWSALRGNLRPLHVYTGVLTPPRYPRRLASLPPAKDAVDLRRWSRLSVLFDPHRRQQSLGGALCNGVGQGIIQREHVRLALVADDHSGAIQNRDGNAFVERPDAAERERYLLPLVEAAEEADPARDLRPVIECVGYFRCAIQLQTG